MAGSCELPKFRGYDMLVHRTQQTFKDERISNFLFNERELDGSLIPSSLLELSASSMTELGTAGFESREIPLLQLGVEEIIPNERTDLITISDSLNLRKIPVKPLLNSAPVVAVDVSTASVGETVKGELFAIRGGLAWLVGDAYNYLRVGPLLFHLAKNEYQPFEDSLRGYGGLSPLANRVLGRLRNRLERWLQRVVSATFESAIVLLDGSLTAGTPDNPSKILKMILSTARDHGNTVLAISKDTKLAVSGFKATEFVRGLTPPCLLDIDTEVTKQFPGYPVQLLGRIYVSKLSPHGFAFRLDVDRELSCGAAVEAVQRLLGRELLHQGYPETLRLAHIFSAFTGNEVIGIQRFLTKRYGLRFSPKLSLRKALFGPFGT